MLSEHLSKSNPLFFLIGKIFFSAVFFISLNSLLSKGWDWDFTILRPLKEIGLCDAVTMIPPQALKCVVAQYTSSVPAIPIS